MGLGLEGPARGQPLPKFHSLREATGRGGAGCTWSLIARRPRDPELQSCPLGHQSSTGPVLLGPRGSSARPVVLLVIGVHEAAQPWLLLLLLLPGHRVLVWGCEEQLGPPFHPSAAGDLKPTRCPSQPRFLLL